MKKDSFNVSSWLKEGFILQTEWNRFILGVGPFQPSLSPCKGLYYRDFFLEGEACWFSPRTLYEFTRAEVESFLGEKEPSFFLRSPSEPPCFVDFQTLFYEIKQKILQKEFQKLVPVFFEEFKAIPEVKLLLSRLFSNTKACKNQGFIYGFWQEQKGTLGFTPEILFSVRKLQFKTMALAGTYPLLSPSLFRDEKENKEQHFVIHSIKEALQDLVCWNAERSYEKFFGNIKHLCTELEGELWSSFDFSYLCERLHPTAALGGYPKRPAVEWLKNKPSQRKRRSFGTPFGFFDGKDQAFCVVSIRGLQWEGGKTYIGSGCGIISESILQKEWREILLKQEQIKTLFQ